jgi:hypothetical protein
MDDICDSVDTVEDTRKQTKDIDTVLQKGGFKVKGWTSNKVLKDQSQTNESEMRVFQGEAEEKLLGLVWSTKTDTFSFNVKADLLKPTMPLQLTKRMVLSRITKIYDPRSCLPRAPFHQWNYKKPKPFGFWKHREAYTTI